LWPLIGYFYEVSVIVAQFHQVDVRVCGVVSLHFRIESLTYLAPPTYYYYSFCRHQKANTIACTSVVAVDLFPFPDLRDSLKTAKLVRDEYLPVQCTCAVLL
jgi:hypothetical protein